jgi:hypothetical protein
MWDCANCGEITVLEPHLNPNESLSHWAYGIKPMPIERKLFLILLSILFAVLAPLSVQIAHGYSWFGENYILAR